MADDKKLEEKQADIESQSIAIFNIANPPVTLKVYMYLLHLLIWCPK